jgi:hypothetical protein
MSDLHDMAEPLSTDEGFNFIHNNLDELAPLLNKQDFNKLKELLKEDHPETWERLIDTEVNRAIYLMNLWAYEGYIEKLQKELQSYSTMLIISGGTLLLISLCKMAQILQ